MKYTMTTPCDNCPFRRDTPLGKSTTARRLAEFASAAFHCHKTGTKDEEGSNFIPTEDSQHCAGALIYLEKRNRPSQMMRIAERLGMYDRSKLNMKAPVK